MRYKIAAVVMIIFINNANANTISQKEKQTNMAIDKYVNYLIKKDKNKKKAEISKVKKLEVLLKSNKQEAKRADSLFEIEKRSPIAVGYFIVDGIKHAIFNYRKVRYSMRRYGEIGGYVVLNIENDYITFRTPNGDKKKSYYKGVYR